MFGGEEKADSSIIGNSILPREFGIKNSAEEMHLLSSTSQQEIHPQSFRNARSTRPAPAPPVAIGVKLKPPIPAPRRFPSVTRGSKQRDCSRRCRALYDCKADNPDELSFRQGDIIVVTKEKIMGENDTWMEGYLENNPLCKGVFPITFVTFLS
ncbi:unnamed protein product [Thelazia callipaeda]|uniref:SH3 domain-containing protein n=1 Tax=Thelazia callipaeda TaxID=103827 RepID=A0A0N5CTE3_THECL|nr:unnamed protein product [Thelazia callipaeda]